MPARIFRRLSAFVSSAWTFPLFLLFLCLAAYALFLPSLGFYWDDIPILWIGRTMGASGLVRYFSTNRPVWGLIYQLTTPLLGSSPLTWQMTAILLRWATGISLWWLVRLVWSRGKTLAAWAAALFVVYPGFSEQSISYVYSHFFIILNLYLLSLCFTVLALKKPRYFWPLMLAGWLASAVNLLSMEYFFLLDLLRPVLIWIVLGQEVKESKRRLMRAVLVWMPFLALFLGVMAWRSLFFGFHTYQPALASRLKTAPLAALWGLAQTALQDAWQVSVGAWQRVFSPPVLPAVANNQLARYGLLVGGVVAAAGLYWLLFRPKGVEEKLERSLWPWQVLGVGVLALFVAGGPFWLTDLQIGQFFPADRFTLPFSIGVSLVIAALLQLLPLPAWIKALPLALLLGFGVGQHFQNGALYKLDWSTQSTLFQEMLWRMPDLKPGTTLLFNELPVYHYTDNSLAAALNWVYDPHNNPSRMSYMLYYPSLRQNGETWLVTQEKGLPIQRDYLATTFYGSTSQIIALYFNPPGCLRVLDPSIDAGNWMTPENLRELLPLSTTDPILASPSPGKDAPHLPPDLNEKVLGQNWCYYFEKADLARQEKDWKAVVELGEVAFGLGDYPNDPAERLPFIEGYAHVGNWQRALTLSQETRAITPVMSPVLCQLWDRIRRETVATAEQQAALSVIRTKDGCK